MKKKIIVAVLLIGVIAIGLGVVLNLDKVNWDYNENVEPEFCEYQNFWLMNGFTSDKDGYYDAVCLFDRRLLYYYNPTNMSGGELVCTQANCKHKDENCKAVFDLNAAEFQYCNGYIFYKEFEDNMDNWLYRCDTDGGNRTKLMLLGDPNEVYSIQRLYVHKNHVIVEQVMKDGKNTRLMDFDMDGLGKYGKGKTIAEQPLNNNYFLLDIKGDRLLYQVIKTNKSKVYEYSLKKGSSKLIYDSSNICRNVKIYGEGLLVSVGARVTFIDSQGKEKQVYDNPNKKYAWISTDGKLIYLFDDEVAAVYDEKMQELCRFDCFNEKEGAIIIPCYFSDGKNLIFTRLDLKQMWLCSVEDIMKGNAALHAVFFN